MVELPYRLASFEMIAYLQHPKVGSAAVDPEVPLSHLADLLIGRGCCIIGGRAQVWKKQRLLQQLESLSEAGVADMLSLQTIPCGHDELPFNEYPDKAEFKEQSVMEAEHGSEVDDLDDIIVEDPVTKPYYIALMRRR